MEKEVETKTLLIDSLMSESKDIFGIYANELDQYLKKSFIYKGAVTYINDYNFFSKETEDINFYDEDNVLKRVVSKTIANNAITRDEYEFGEDLFLDGWKRETAKFDISTGYVRTEDLKRELSVSDEILHSDNININKEDIKKKITSSVYIDDSNELMIIITSSIDKSTGVTEYNIVSTLNVNIDKNPHRFTGTEIEYHFYRDGIVKDIIESNVTYVRTIDGELICVDKEYNSKNDADKYLYQEFIRPICTMKEGSKDISIKYCNQLDKPSTYEDYEYTEDGYRIVKSKVLTNPGDETSEEGETTIYGYNKDKFINIIDQNMKAKIGYVISYKFGDKSYMVAGETNKFSNSEFTLSLSKDGNIGFSKNSFLKSVYRSNMLGKNYYIFNRLNFMSSDDKSYEFEYDEFGIISSLILDIGENNVAGELAEYNKAIVDDEIDIIESLCPAGMFEKDQSYFYNVALVNKKEQRIEYNYQALIVHE